MGRILGCGRSVGIGMRACVLPLFLSLKLNTRLTMRPIRRLMVSGKRRKSQRPGLRSVCVKDGRLLHHLRLSEEVVELEIASSAGAMAFEPVLVKFCKICVLLSGPWFSSECFLGDLY